MIVLQVEEYKKNRYKVCMDDGTHLILYKGDMRRFGIAEGIEIPMEQYEVLYHEVLGKRVKKRALALLEKMDRTEKGLYDKLKEQDYPNELIEEAISYVKQYHYIDDQRYAQNYISYHQNGKSRMRLKQDLLRKGVQKEIIEQALLECYCQNELEQIEQIMQKKGYSPQEADRKQMQKMYGYLARKGFKNDDILRAMKSSEYLT